MIQLIEAITGFYKNQVTWFTDNVLWSTYTFIVLMGLGILFSIWTKFIQYRALTHGVNVLRGAYDDKRDPGAINHFQALSAALSATVGLGNIGGVALAVALGGPGAVFWMWVTGFLGMAIKSVEVTLAMLYRDTSDPNDPHGGAMWVIQRGWGDVVGGWARPAAWLIGAIFCITLLISTATGGNMFQVWNVAQITNTYFGIPQIVTAIILSVLTGVVIIGGIKRIGAVAGRLVPFMCALYLIAVIVVLVVQARNIPGMLWQIVSDALAPTEAAGAFLGASAWFGLTTGLRRALFSNEAGQGSSPIAHSAAKTDEPVREGVVAGLEPFIDTCLVCTMTALVLLSTDTWKREAVGDFASPVNLVHSVQPAVDSQGQPLTNQDDTPAAPTVSWTVDASTDPNQLPVLPAPDAWLAGNRFFLLARVQDNTNTSTDNNLIRIIGTLARRDGQTQGATPAAVPDQQGESDVGGGDAAGGATVAPGQLYIQWEDIELDSDDWTNPITAGTDIQMVDQSVFRDLVASSLTGHAFDRAIPGLGRYLVTITCWLFAYSTMISWSYYGEQGVVFLFGTRSVLLYKIVYCILAVIAGWPGFIETDTDLGLLADLGTGCMLLANVPIIVFMAPKAIRAMDDYFRRLRSGQMPTRKLPPIVDVVEGRDVE